MKEEHFNENYVESNEFPKAKFKGSISNIVDFKLESDKKFIANIECELTIHGVTKHVAISGELIKENGQIKGNSKFIIKPEDYNIKIPALVRDKIAKEVDVNVEILLIKMQE